MVKLVANFSSCELGFSGKISSRHPVEAVPADARKTWNSEPAEQHQNPRVFHLKRCLRQHKKQRKNLPVIVTRVFFYFWILDHHFCYCLLFSFFWQRIELGKLHCFCFFLHVLTIGPNFPRFFSSLERRTRKKHIASENWGNLEDFRVVYLFLFFGKGNPYQRC